MSINNILKDLKRDLEDARFSRAAFGYRNEKEAITRAIVNSEKIAQASVIDAGVKSKYILRDASEKAAKMVNSANNEYERKIKEAKKLNDEIEAFVNDCIEKFGNQIESMKNFTKIPIKPLDLEKFQIDDIARNFIYDDKSTSTTQIFSDGAAISSKIS